MRPSSTWVFHLDKCRWSTTGVIGCSGSLTPLSSWVNYSQNHNYKVLCKITKIINVLNDYKSSECKQIWQTLNEHLLCSIDNIIIALQDESV
jgi:hypothetical protein